MRIPESLVIRIDAPGALLPRLRQARDGLISGLLGIQWQDGWPDTHLIDTIYSTWTTIVVLTSLLKHSVIPKNILSAVKKVCDKKRKRNGLIGWDMDERFTQSISSYVTADALSLFFMLGNFEEAAEITLSLQTMRNNDGGWGVCPEDSISRVVTTRWVASALLDAYEHPVTRSIVNAEIVEQAVKWLYNAQNEFNRDFGWGLFPNLPPSSVGATSETLLFLLRVAENHKEFGIRMESLRRAIETLKKQGVNGYWKGEAESFAIDTTDGIKARHVTGGLGTISTVGALIKAARIGLLSPEDHDLFLGLDNILSRCKEHPGKPGLWITPSDQGGPPIIWNSAYALDVIDDILVFYTDIEGEYVDRTIYEAINTRTNKWKRITLALLVASFGVILAISLKGFVPALGWFSGLSPLLQGLILIIITLMVEEVYHRVFVPIFTKLRMRAG